MKNKNLVVTIGVLIVGAVLAWFGFGDKLGQQADKSGTQEVATTTPAKPSNSSDDAQKAAPESKSDASGTEAKVEDAPKQDAEKSSDVAADKKAAEGATGTDASEMKKADASEQASEQTDAQTGEQASDKAAEPAKLMADTAEKAAKLEEAAKVEAPATDEQKPAEKVAEKAESSTDGQASKPEGTAEQAAADTSKGMADAAAVTEESATGAAPSFDVVRVEPDGNTLVAGKAAPGSIVELMNGDQVLAKATADASGAWVMILEEALRKGVHDLSLASKAKEGAAAVLSKSNIAVAIPETGELLVVESEPGQASKILAQIAKDTPKAAEMAKEPAKMAEKAMDKAGEAADAAKSMADESKDAVAEGAADVVAKVDAAEKAIEDAAKQVEAAAGAADEAAKDAMAKAEMAKKKPAEIVDASVAVKAIELEGDVLYVAGDAKPAGSMLRLYVDNRPISNSKSSEAGTFLFDGPISLDVGSHDVRVDLLSAVDGKVLSRAQVSFEKKAPIMAKQGNGDNGTTTASAAQSNGQIANAVSDNGEANGGQQQVVNSRKVIIRRGDNLWEIARRVYGAGYRYSTIYDGNTAQIRDPHWIYPGQVFDLPEGEEGWEQNFDAVEAPSAEDTNSQ